MRNLKRRVAYWDIRQQRRVVIFAFALLICFVLHKKASLTAVPFLTERRSRQGLENNSRAMEDEVSLKTLKPLLLLVANQRSGSTFLGEIFNQNPRGFYLFEPLFPFSKHCDHLARERVDLLNDLFQCSFKNMRKSYQNAFKITKFSDEDAECLKNNICFETSHKPLLRKYAKLCASPGMNASEVFRTEGSKLMFDPNSQSCGFPLNTSKMSQLCEASDFVVFKVLRLCNLRDIERLRQDLKKSGYDIFVLHLVRDPRAVVASRVNLRVDGVRLHNAPAETDLLCDRYKRNVRYITEIQSDIGPNIITEGRYMRVRHEDFTLHPFDISTKIYNFIGMKMPDEAITFLSKSHQNGDTILERIRREDERAARDHKEPKKYTRSKDILWHMNNPFGTIRDPKQVLTKWRTQLPFSVVKVIEDKCGDVFKVLGYKLFTSNVDLVNMTKTFF